MKAVTKKEKKERRKLADEVCWGLSLAANFGFSKAEAIDYIWADFMKWADVALPLKEGD